MQAILMLLLVLSALLTACDDETDGPPLPPLGSPPASTRATIVPGAMYIQTSIRIRPDGGSGAAIALQVEVPANEAASQQGLMGSPPLPDGHGMLFVMAKKSCAFWMKDTPSPLSIA